MATTKQTAIRITASASVGALILVIQFGRLFVRRFGPHPVRAARSTGADVAWWVNELIESLRLREPIRDENVDVLVEAISSGAVAVAEYRRGRRMESRYDPDDRSLPTGGP